MHKAVEKLILKTKKWSPKCFINEKNELIIEPTNNIYFRLEDVKNELDFKCKVLAWLSRPSCKGLSKPQQTHIRIIVNEVLGTNFTKDDMCKIYTYLGNDCNRELSVTFIKSKYDLSLLID